MLRIPISGLYIHAKKLYIILLTTRAFSTARKRGCVTFCKIKVGEVGVNGRTKKVLLLLVVCVGAGIRVVSSSPGLDPAPGSVLHKCCSFLVLA